jgi:hypothetical protein
MVVVLNRCRHASPSQGRAQAGLGQAELMRGLQLMGEADAGR